MVVIAQLAEHRIVVPSVVGSSPTLHPRSVLPTEREKRPPPKRGNIRELYGSLFVMLFLAREYGRSPAETREDAEG